MPDPTTPDGQLDAALGGALGQLGPDAPTPEAQAEVERVMTTETVPLAVAARLARRRRDEAAARLREEALAAYQQEAPRRALEAARKVLGSYADRATWTPTGHPFDRDVPDYASVGEVDGLRFLVAVDYDYDYPVERVCLLRPCPNPDGFADHGSVERTVRIGDLAALADALERDDPAEGHCPECARLRGERVEEVIEQAKTAEQRLREVLDKIAADQVARYHEVYGHEHPHESYGGRP